LLLDARGGVVTRTELMNAAWPGAAIEESNLTVQIAALRKSLGELSAGEEWIRTVPRIGYQFAGSISADESGEERHPPDRAPPGRQKAGLSIAVLPFRNLSNDPEQTPFCDGLSEDLITDLSKVPGVTVIARNSSFAYREKHIPSLGGPLRRRPRRHLQASGRCGRTDRSSAARRAP
jgi:DNA-binding winged helix-turn-helix (wHTH) protein